MYIQRERGGGRRVRKIAVHPLFVREEVEEKDVLYTYSCVSPLLSSLVAFLSATPLTQRERERKARPVVYASPARRDSGVQTFRVGGETAGTRVLTKRLLRRRDCGSTLRTLRLRNTS